MDASQIMTLTGSVLPALQPYLPVLAGAAMEKTVEIAFEKLPEAVGKLWQALKAKFDTKAGAKEILQDLLKEPGNADVQAAFRVQLKKLLEEDEQFAGQVQRLLAESPAGVSYRAEASGAGVIVQGEKNTVAGAGGVIVKGDVKGDISTGSIKKE
jgi:hypothetical protein